MREALLREGIITETSSHVMGDYVLVPSYPWFQNLGQLFTTGAASLFSSVKEIAFIGSCVSQAKTAAKKRKFCDNGLKTIVITLGGSASMISLLESISASISMHANYIIIVGNTLAETHAAVLQNVERIRRQYPDAKIVLEEFVSTIEDYLSYADVAVIHGGLSTMMECIIFHTPCGE